MYDRVSQSGPDSEAGPQEAHYLSPAPLPRRERQNGHGSRSQSRRTREPRWEREQDILMEYDDPPPLSISRAFRERDRERNRDGGSRNAPLEGPFKHAEVEPLNQPFSLEDYNQRTRGEGLSFSPPRPVQVRKQHAQEPLPSRVPQEHIPIYHPVPTRHSVPPPIPPSVDLGRVNRSDSLLGRVFPHTDGGHSVPAERSPSTAPSTFSHAVQARSRPSSTEHAWTARTAMRSVQVHVLRSGFGTPPSRQDVIDTERFSPRAQYLSPSPHTSGADARRRSRGGVSLADPPAGQANASDPGTSRRPVFQPVPGARPSPLRTLPRNASPYIAEPLELHSTHWSARPPASSSVVHSPRRLPLSPASEASPPDAPAPYIAPALRRAPIQTVMPAPLAPQPVAGVAPAMSRYDSGAYRIVEYEADEERMGRSLVPPASSDRLGVHSLSFTPEAYNLSQAGWRPDHTASYGR